ncbi:MAG: peptidylprolyl isomerase [Candidatus Doudnabacteria bacterium]|nr:peptidylprolyl isomerase [Candidatus Doudnabacteria bacterium]
MTNKTLFVIACAVVVLGVAAAAYYYWQNTRPLVVSSSQISNPDSIQQNNNSQMSFNPPPAEQKQPAAASSTPAAAACTRDFNQNKLGSNAGLNIHNRTVEIDVANFGKIQVQFYDQDAPKTVENFLRLTDAGYYDCLTFHRVSKGFVIQGGDPSGNGSGGTSAYGAPFADELNSKTASYKAGYVKGVLAMANSGPNTNGSQFFIMLADNTTLPHNYTIFGHVTMGLDVVDKIGQVAITPQMGPTDGSPVTPVVMQSVKIIK